jgi:hypothetical protein
MLVQIAKVEEVINASQQVFARDVTIKVERVQEFVLSTAQLTHHDESLPSIDVFRIPNIPNHGRLFQHNQLQADVGCGR